MASQTNTLGIMKPVGGGDPVNLRKAELTVGRRASCDVCLDFENVSGNTACSFSTTRCGTSVTWGALTARR